MLFNELSRLKRPLLLLLGCAIAFTSAMLGTSLLVRSDNKVPDYANEGFDFSFSSDGLLALLILP